MKELDYGNDSYIEADACYVTLFNRHFISLNTYDAQTKKMNAHVLLSEKETKRLIKELKTALATVKNRNKRS